MGLEREALFADTEITVARHGNPFVPQLENLKSFLNAPHVAVVGSGIAEDPVDRWLREEGYAKRIVLRIASYWQAIQAVAVLNLVAFVPKRLAESIAPALSLALLRPPIDPGTYQEYVFYPRRAAEDLASIWLRKVTLEIGPQLRQRRAAA